jgi:hydrogenase-4 component B
MGAGSIIFRTHTRDLEKMGGLIKLMPVTALCFLLGAMAVTALPPLNGFASEWFTYQTMFMSAFSSDIIIKVVFAIAIVALVITGALAVAAFVKAFGLGFLGAPRSEQTSKAREVPFSMKFGMLILGLFCVGFGVGAPWVVPHMRGIAISALPLDHLFSTPPPMGYEDFLFANNMAAYNIATSGDASLAALGQVSPPMTALLLIGLVALVVVVTLLLRRSKVSSNREPWQCGYLPESDMYMKPSSFGGQMNTYFRPIFAVREAITATSDKFRALLFSTQRTTEKVEKLGDRYVVDTVSSFIKWLSLKSQNIEGGNFKVYLLYIVVTLVVLLTVAIVF